MNNSTEIKKFLLWYDKADLRSCSIPFEMITYLLCQNQRTFTFNWSYNNMKSFLKELNNQERTFYQKIYLVTGISHDPKTLSDKQLDKTAQELTNQQTFDLCRFSKREVYSDSVKNVIQSFRENGTGNTCLHVAGQYGNMSMLNYILNNKVIDCNLRNTYGDTTLMHTLRNSKSNSFQKSVLLLSKFSDLNLVDAKERRPDEITLASYSKSRARIMQILRQQYIARSKQ